MSRRLVAHLLAQLNAEEFPGVAPTLSRSAKLAREEKRSEEKRTEETRREDKRKEDKSREKKRQEEGKKKNN
jgi:tRNA(Ile)-lysidine synthase TilS/MesJ